MGSSGDFPPAPPASPTAGAAAAGGSLQPEIELMQEVEVRDSNGARWEKGLAVEVGPQGVCVLTEHCENPRVYSQVRPLGAAPAAAGEPGVEDGAGGVNLRMDNFAAPAVVFTVPLSDAPERLRVRSIDADSREVDGEYNNTSGMQVHGCPTWRTAEGHMGDYTVLHATPDGYWGIFRCCPILGGVDNVELLVRSAEPHQGRPPTEARDWLFSAKRVVQLTISSAQDGAGGGSVDAHSANSVQEQQTPPQQQGMTMRGYCCAPTGMDPQGDLLGTGAGLDAFVPTAQRAGEGWSPLGSGVCPPLSPPLEECPQCVFGDVLEVRDYPTQTWAAGLVMEVLDGVPQVFVDGRDCRSYRHMRKVPSPAPEAPAAPPAPPSGGDLPAMAGIVPEGLGKQELPALRCLAELSAGSSRPMVELLHQCQPSAADSCGQWVLVAASAWPVLERPEEREGVRTLFEAQPGATVHVVKVDTPQGWLKLKLSDEKTGWTQKGQGAEGWRANDVPPIVGNWHVEDAEVGGSTAGQAQPYCVTSYSSGDGAPMLWLLHDGSHKRVYAADDPQFPKMTLGKPLGWDPADPDPVYRWATQLEGGPVWFRTSKGATELFCRGPGAGRIKDEVRARRLLPLTPLFAGVEPPLLLDRQAPEQSTGPVGVRATVLPGNCGLSNLGNTCFMNSAVQCLSHTEGLRVLLLGNEWESEVNEHNPLGAGGQLVREMAATLRILWTGEYSSLRPTALREVLCSFAPRFRGHAQHDAQELLSCLLDGLHEDLKRPPGSSSPDSPHDAVPDLGDGSDGEPPEASPHAAPAEAAGEADALPAQQHPDEAWAAHVSRGHSRIAELFHGQMHSRVRCDSCRHCAYSYDPFSLVSIPVPDAAAVQAEAEQGVARVRFVPADPEVAATRLAIRLQAPEPSVRDLLEAVAGETQVPRQRLHLIADWSGREPSQHLLPHHKHRRLDDRLPPHCMANASVYELPESPAAGEDAGRLCVIRIVHRHKGAQGLWNALPIGPTVTLLPADASDADLCAAVDCTMPCPKDVPMHEDSWSPVATPAPAWPRTLNITAPGDLAGTYDMHSSQEGVHSWWRDDGSRAQVAWVDSRWELWDGNTQRYQSEVVDYDRCPPHDAEWRGPDANEPLRLYALETPMRICVALTNGSKRWVELDSACAISSERVDQEALQRCVSEALHGELPARFAVRILDSVATPSRRRERPPAFPPLLDDGRAQEEADLIRALEASIADQVGTPAAGTDEVGLNNALVSPGRGSPETIDEELPAAAPAPGALLPAGVSDCPDTDPAVDVQRPPGWPRNANAVIVPVPEDREMQQPVVTVRDASNSWTCSGWADGAAVVDPENTTSPGLLAECHKLLVGMRAPAAGQPARPDPAPPEKPGDSGGQDAADSAEAHPDPPALAATPAAAAAEPEVVTVEVEWPDKQELAMRRRLPDADDPSVFREQEEVRRREAELRSGSTLAACMQRHNEEEPLDESNAWRCPRCKVLRSARKRLGLRKLPPYLVVHLKRFAYTGGIRRKISTHISYPLAGLDLAPYLHEDEEGPGRDEQQEDTAAAPEPPPLYDLYGVCCHHGGGDGTYGHYTAFCRTAVGWTNFDDETVKEVGGSAVVTSSAYMLFYRARGKDDPPPPDAAGQEPALQHPAVTAELAAGAAALALALGGGGRGRGSVPHI